MSDEWKPIDTAPKDGTRVLLGWKRQQAVMIAHWNEEGATKWESDEDDVWVKGPTHWMPLPSPPEDPPMSKAAELTREELVERLGVAIWRSRENVFPHRVRRMLPDNVDRASGAYATVAAQAVAVLSELKALGLAVVPVEPTTRMWSDGDMEVHDAADPSDIWKAMLSSSPFACN